MSLLYFALYYIYITYIDVKIESNYEIQRTQSTEYKQTVEEALQESQTIADMIETVSSSVVGISKLKNNSSSIFSNNFGAELGIGTGLVTIVGLLFLLIKGGDAKIPAGTSIQNVTVEGNYSIIPQ